MKGQATVPTIIYTVILLMIFSSMIPLMNSAINNAWEYLNPMGRALASFIVPAFLIGIILVPFDYHSVLNYIRRNEDEFR